MPQQENWICRGFSSRSIKKSRKYTKPRKRLNFQPTSNISNNKSNHSPTKSSLSTIRPGKQSYCNFASNLVWGNQPTFQNKSTEKKSMSNLPKWVSSENMILSYVTYLSPIFRWKRRLWWVNSGQISWGSGNWFD